jgi:hypothetical protein
VRIEIGSTFRFKVTTHIKTNAINQLISDVCIKLNFLDIKYIAIENKNPHAIHIIPFIGAEGKDIPSD